MDNWVNSLRRSVSPQTSQRPRVRTRGRLCQASPKTPRRPILRTQARGSGPPAIRRDGTPPGVCKRAGQPIVGTPRVVTVRRSSTRRRWGPPRIILPGNVSDLAESATMCSSRCLRSSSHIDTAYGRDRSVDGRPGTAPPKWAQRSFPIPFAISFKEETPDIDLMEAMCMDNLKAMLEAVPKATGCALEAALEAATRRAQPALVAALLAAGADPEAPTARAADADDGDGLSPLHWAAAGGGAGLRCAELLLRAGAYVDVTTTVSGRTPLHLAALHDHADCALLLLNAGADFCALDADGRAPADYGGTGFALAMDAFFRRPAI